MASLVIGVGGALLGSFLGGPLGASIGYALGSAVGSIFSKGGQTTQQQDLRLATSQYGKMIPLVWAGFRVPSQCVWSTDLMPHSHKGGKGGLIGGPSTKTYSASGAFLLCTGPVDRVQKIWADGTLIYDTSGDNPGLPSLPITIYTGTTTQSADPTMQGYLGVDFTPAMLGYCYFVMDNLDLSTYGNRWPQFTAEVVTTGQARLLSLVNVNYADGVPTFNEGYTYQADTNRYIVDWELGQQPITATMYSPGIRDYTTTLVLANYHDPTTLDAVGDASDAPFLFPQMYGLISRFGVCAYQYSSGATKYLWERNIGGTFASMALAGFPYLTDSSGTYDFIASTGVPTSLYPGGVCLTQDQKTMFIFTKSTSGGLADHWYKLIDGATIDDGTISAGSLDNLTSTQGKRPMVGGASSVSVENNGQYFWVWHDGDEEAHICYLDPGTKDLADWGAGSIVVPFRENGSAPNGTETGSLCTLSTDGYCGVVLGTGIALLSRIAPGVVGVPLYQIVEDLSEGGPNDIGPNLGAGLTSGQVDASALIDIVDGYMIDTQSACRDNITPLQSAFFFDGVESAGVMKFVKRGASPLFTIPTTDLAAQQSGDTPPPLVEVKRAQEVDLPATVSVTYVDANNDYQTGTQYARREVTDSQAVVTAQLNIVMTTAKAASVAWISLFNAWMERNAFTVTLPRSYWRNEPTDVWTANNYTMRLIRKADDVAGVVKFEGLGTNVGVWVSGPVPAPGSGGGTVTPPPTNGTTMLLLDIPIVVDSDYSNGFYIAGAPTVSTSWPGFVAYKSMDNGGNYTSIATIDVPSVMGVTTTALAPFYGGNMFDEGNSVTVALSGGVGSLDSANMAAVLNGANMALVGDELIQFRIATLVSAGVYTLSGLLRGRRGTEFAMYSHTVGERFVATFVTDVNDDASEINLPELFKAVTNGDSLGDVTAQSFTNTGNGARCYSPVAVGGAPITPFDGTVQINWQRRTRIGGAWNNNSDVPLSEAKEEFILQIWDSTYTQCARIITVDNAQTVTYTAAQQTADFGATQKHVYVTVGQVGTFALGIQTPAVIPGLGASDNAPTTPIPPYNTSPPPSPSGGCTLPEQTDSWTWATPAILYNAAADSSHTWVISFTTGTAFAGSGRIAASEYNGPPTLRTMSISTSPCGPPLTGGAVGGTAPEIIFWMQGNPNPGSYPTLLPSTTYYVSINSAAASGMSAELIHP